MVDLISLSHRWKIFFVSALVLLVFVPSFFGGVCRIDDAELLSSLHSIDDFNFFTFIRGGTGLYYRPLISASFKLDALLFNANVAGMHAENVLLHLVNTLLLIAVLRQVFYGMEGGVLPYFCGLLWGVHPITTESVNWISGRSDVLSSFFVLLSTLFLLRYRKNGRLYFLLLTVFFFVCGMLTKEVVLPFVVLAILVLRAHDNSDSDKCSSSCVSLLEGRGLAMWLLPTVVAGVVFLRIIAYNSTSCRIVSTLRFIFTDLYYSAFVCLRALGFYCKKILFPLPLNFAIMEVDPLYELLAIPIVLLCVYLLRKRDMLSSLFLGGVALLTPPMLIAFHQIAWTPYAERYAYLSSAFVLPPVVSYFDRHLDFQSDRLKKVFVISLFLFFALSSLARNAVWRTNEELFADTAAKSPYSMKTQAIYADILIQHKRYDDALVAIKKARSVCVLGYYSKPDILEAKILEEQGNIRDAVELLRKGAIKSKYRSEKTLRALVEVLKHYSLELPVAQRSGIYIEMRNLRLKLFRLSRDFENIYEMAILSDKLGDKQRAAALLHQVLRNQKEDSPLAAKAKNQLEQLGL